MQNNTIIPADFTVSGEGIPVIFLHGFMEDATMWNPIIEKLTGIQAICVDLFGHGKSDFDQEVEPSIEFMAKQIMAVVDKLQLPFPQIVGHSLGGYVALSLAQQTDQFEHITLLHSHPWADNDQRKKDRNRVIDLVKTRAAYFVSEAIPNLYAHPSQRSVEIERNSTIANNMNNKAIGWAAAAMRDRPDYSEVMIQNPQKFTFLQGKMDNLIPRVPVENFASEHGISYLELGKSGHMAHEEETETLTTILQMLLTP